MFKIQRLTKFNQALVYAFSPEMSPKQMFGSTHYEDILYAVVFQSEDVFNAYLYAQDNILPWIEANGIQQITEEKLLSWILDLHKYIAKTVLAFYEKSSGEYIKDHDGVMRWQHGGGIGLAINKIVYSEKFDDYAEDFIQEYVSEYHIDPKVCRIFVDIVKRIRAESLKETGNKLTPILMTSFFKKLIAVRRENKLSETEKEALDKVVKFGLPEKEIPAAMQQYVRETLKVWQQLDPNDLQGTAKGLAEVFYQFTKTHPFANGNGRTATCIVNIILKSIGLPDIIIREPNDRNDVESEYSKAMDCIDVTRQPFAKHILKCIERAKSEPYQNPELKYHLKLRMDLVEKFKALEKNPAFDARIFNNELQEIIDLQKDVTESLHLHLQKAEQKEKQLKGGKIHATFGAVSNPLKLYQDALEEYKSKNYKLAITILKVSLAGFKEKCGEDSLEVAKCYSTFASIYRDNKQLDLAVQACAQSVACFERLKDDKITSAMTKYNECLELFNEPAAKVYGSAVKDYKEKKFHGAICQLLYCIKRWECDSEQEEALSTCYSTMASCQRGLGFIDEAITSCQFAEKLCKKDEKRQLIQTKLANLQSLKDKEPISRVRKVA